MNLTVEEILKELSFKTSRSSGKGGQNVNKVSSKVEANFPVKESQLFSDEEKARILSKLANRINADGILQVTAEEDRSQLRNKAISAEKILALLKNALHVPTTRKPTKPRRADIEKRLRQKQLRALKKISRRKDF